MTDTTVLHNWSVFYNAQLGGNSEIQTHVGRTPEARYAMTLCFYSRGFLKHTERLLLFRFHIFSPRHSRLYGWLRITAAPYKA